MEQVVQEFNAETSKWDTLPAAPPEKLAEPPAPVADVDADDDAPAPVAAKPAVEDKPKAAKPRHDADARIAQVIAKQKEAERRAEDAERKARDLEARLTPKQEPAQATPALDKFPEYASYLQTNPGASLEQWLDARDEWRDTRREAQVTAQRETERVEQAFTTRATKFSESFAKAREADPELDGRINQDLLTVRPYSMLTAQDKSLIRNIQNPVERDRVAFLCFLADQWIDSDHAPALLEHLSDPQQFQRLATLPPNQVIRELANLESRLGGAAPQKADSAPKGKPVTSKATPPIDPVGSSPHTTDTDPADTDSDEEWLRKENARLLRSRRRG